MVALSCFLCPNSNIFPSTKYMIAFKDLSCVGNIDWSLYIYEWLIDAVRKLCIGVGKSLRPIRTFGGCSYVLAVSLISLSLQIAIICTSLSSILMSILCYAFVVLVLFYCSANLHL